MLRRLLGLDRLARSVVHLAQISALFEKEGVNLMVLDRNIDTSTNTGRLMFSMLAAIAEFENDLRSEREADGIAKAREINGDRVIDLLSLSNSGDARHACRSLIKGRMPARDLSAISDATD